MSSTELRELPDRRWLLQALESCMAASTEDRGLTALIVIKVERLRDISIELGYQEGDELLNMVVERLGGCLRDSDRLARLATAEFAAILPALRSQSQPLMAVTKMQRMCAEPFEVDGKSLNVKLTYGVSISPLDVNEPQPLLRCAHVALRHAQVSGLESALYSECGDDASIPFIAMENELESAIRASDLQSTYQPIVDINTGALTGVELLTRWTSRRYGTVAPRVFIPLAEAAGLVMPLTLWTLNTALREWADWHPSLPNTTVSINLSAKVLADPHLPDLILRALKVWDTGLGQLAVDVTESAMMADPKACLRVLNQLHDNGVGIAIDDFGTGYSSLAYLKDLPVSVLKIDESFVVNMLESAADRRIVQAVIDLAHNFDLTVVAEGVADEETLDTLTLMGCERAQGRQIAEPMAAEQLESWVTDSPWEVNTEDADQLKTYLSAVTSESRTDARSN